MNKDPLFTREELIEILDESIEWHRGDKWRSSEVELERREWGRRMVKLQAAIAKARGEQP